MNLAIGHMYKIVLYNYDRIYNDSVYSTFMNWIET